MEARLPQVRRIIVEDWRGMWRYRHPNLTSFAEVLRLGRDLEASQPDLFDQLVNAGQPDDTAIFCQTSGTTALPKLAMLSHRHLLAQGLNFHSVEPHIGPKDEFVSYLPFAWIGEQMIAMTLHQLIGFVISFPEEPETAQRDFREISPHFTFAPARIYEALHTGEGEIISRSPSVFLGYYKNPEATSQALRGGWLYTGDYGTLDPTGDIIMFDRMSDVITLADGSKMSPWIIEAMLKFTPYIQ